jgi:hypothetical protein
MECLNYTSIISEKVSDLKKLLLGSSKVSITCELWTTKNCLSFFGVTVPWIDNNFEYCFKGFQKLLLKS